MFGSMLMGLILSWYYIKASCLRSDVSSLKRPLFLHFGQY